MLIGKSIVIKEIRKFIEKASRIEYSILLLGETGVGKTLIAHLIHLHSKRKGGPFLHQNCSNIQETLFESELFGHEKGSFTGAEKRKIGKIELANGGTLLLDEIADLNPQNQAKLLLFLESGKFFRIGGTKEIKADVRVISASNKDLHKEIKEKRFREDLYYRISTLELHIPPLRERKEDIPLLIEYFLEIENKENKTNKTISKKALLKLMGYNFPGNIRELENIIRRAFTLSEDNLIREENILFPTRESKKKTEKKPRYSMEEILNILLKHNGNKTKAAKELGISRRHIYRLIKSKK
ncbi:sigma-54 dependent transcriptional regulator [Candidatus Aminicenantes bacterium AH-873-B07]|nr:sigma-54 dependent transcriptional regulator [Candidatus Aminicenantes bacterium AH-873-B07]